MRIDTHITHRQGSYMLLIPMDKARLLAQAWELPLESLKNRAVSVEVEV